MYACKGILNKDIYEGQVNIDRFVLNSTSQIIDNHNNYKLIMTPVVKNGKPVLNHFGNPLKVYEIAKYICTKSGQILIKSLSLPIYSYTKAVNAFEIIRLYSPATPWQEQYYQDRPHLYELVNGHWHRKAYEMPTIITAPKPAAPVAKTTTKKQKPAKIATPAIDAKREDKIRKAVDKAVKEKRDLTDFITDDDFIYAMNNMNLDIFNVTRWRTKHPLTNEPIK